MDDKLVELDSQSIFWNIISIPKDDEDGKYIELQWGWTAGMSEEDLKNVAEDAPTGYDFVRILPDQAKDLRDQLDAWLASIEKPLHVLTPEEKADIEACIGENCREFAGQIAKEAGEMDYDGDSTPLAPWED
jgi:hypothetical protein